MSASPDSARTAPSDPLITWRVDLTDPNAIEVTASIDAKVKITPTDGSLFDFKHSGTLTAKGGAGAVTSVALELEFTGLFLLGDPPITATAALDANGKGSGSVKDGDQVIANIKKSLELEWLDDCAPSAP